MTATLYADDAMNDAFLSIALDLAASLDTEARYEHLLEVLERVVPCDAAALLRYQDGALEALATRGLSSEALGHRFVVAEHPRLASIVASRDPVRFAADDPRPDPYDGLVSGSPDLHPHVHSCMGCALHIGTELVGALTVDALDPGRFDAVDDDTFATFAALAAAAMRTALLIEALEEAAERRGRVARDLLDTALERRGGEILGPSEAMRALRAEVALAAESELAVLITGETGVGKELVARSLHRQSRRAEEALVYVNCAALPESIAESELFGHVKGAFTGAVANRAGKFELAHRGTLFLDEVGELPLSLQAKLLRALQFGEIQRVGSDRALRVDARVVSATNRDLAAEVGAGRFRADLYHRLSVYPIHVAPLRERRDDVLVLAGFFIDRARARLGLESIHLTPAARLALAAYEWPGNVRELEHVLLRGALRAAAGRKRAVHIEPAHLGLDARSAATAELAAVEGAGPGTGAVDGAPSSSEDAGGPELTLAEAVERCQRRTIEAAVARADGNWAEAARHLGVDRGNLHRIAKRLGLK